MRGKIKWLIAIGVAVLLIAAITIPALAAGPLGSPSPSPSPTGQPGWANCRGLGYGIDDAVTQLLGMTGEQIQAQRQAGKSLVQIAASKNISEDALINAIVADRQNTLQQMVTSGTLTQAQADQRLAYMKQQIKQNVNRTTVGPPANRGMMGGFGSNSNPGNGTATPGACPGGGGMMRFGRTAR